MDFFSEQLLKLQRGLKRFYIQDCLNTLSSTFLLDRIQSKVVALPTPLLSFINELLSIRCNAAGTTVMRASVLVILSILYVKLIYWAIPKPAVHLLFAF